MGSSMWFILWCSCVLFCSWSQTACAKETKLLCTSSDGFSVGDTYGCGPYNATIQVDLRSPCCDTGLWSRSCPCGNNLVVAAPIKGGEYPVVQFQHGTSLDGSAYEDVILQIATWGFIVVAPKMYVPTAYLIPPGDAIQEINDARAILNGLPTWLVPVLSPWTEARPWLEKIALVGHSRGGKVVYGVALNVTSSSITIPHFSAVVGLDPVDGTGDTIQLQPPVLTHINNSLHLGDDVQTLVVGTGLGPTLLFPWFLNPPPCAPENYGHKYFYGDVAPPAFHFVASTQGHMDFCDCDSKAIWKLLCGFCRNGDPKVRPQMHHFTGGIVAAFLQKALLDNSTAFDAAYKQYSQAPVALLRPESKLAQIPHLAQSHQHASV